MELIELGFPKESIFKKFIPKSYFYEHGGLKQSEKNLFINNIERMTLYAQLTREKTNISKYNDEEKTYEEISVLLVDLRKKENMDKIAKIIMSAILYPIILVGKYDDEYIFYGANQRDNQLDESKIILENIYSTDYIDLEEPFIKSINYKKLSKVNFYKFYNDYLDAIINFNLKKRNIQSAEDKEEVLRKIEELEEEIRVLKNKMHSEKQFNRKMDLNIKIKGLEKELKKMEGKDD